MRYGIVLFTSDRGITPATAAAAAESRGFDTFYVPEHTHIPVRREAVHPGTGTAELPDDRYSRTLDPWVALAMAATVTTRIRLATAVALPFESDAITLAKTIATLDHLSGGRVTLGAGFGWNTDEMADHGIPGTRRKTALREHLEAMRALWTQEEAAYDGDFVSFGPSWAYPKPVQQPLPVLLGAGGTEKNFDWLVQHADGWLTTPNDVEIDEKVAQLRAMWSAAGRPDSPEVVALAVKPHPDRIAHLASIGVTECVFGLPDKSGDEVLAYLDRLRGRLDG